MKPGYMIVNDIALALLGCEVNPHRLANYARRSIQDS
jgi:hypothetical protein